MELLYCGKEGSWMSNSAENKFKVDVSWDEHFFFQTLHNKVQSMGILLVWRV